MTSVFILILLAIVMMTAAIANWHHRKSNKKYSEYLKENPKRALS